MMKPVFYSILFVVAILFLSSCADAVDIDKCQPDNPSGFLLGIWHGFIVFFSFIFSIFSDGVAIYDINNTGGWYDFGFMIGIGGFSFGAGKASS